MRITITGINFNYDEGFDKDCTSVDVNYITSGFGYDFNNGQPVNISYDQYEQIEKDKDQLRILVADKIIADAAQFIDDIKAYKDSLTNDAE